jgi:hypothetical protein
MEMYDEGHSFIFFRLSRWATLPSEMVNAVVRYIQDIANISLMTIRRQSAKAVKDVHNLEDGVPMLITSASVGDGLVAESDFVSGAFDLHVVGDSISYQSHLDVMMGQSWLGSKDDWLVTIDQDVFLSLINPISGKTRSLPSLSNNSLGNDEILSDVREDGGRGPIYIQRAVLCKTPRQEDGPFVILLFSSGLIMYTEKTKDTWTALPIDERLSFLTFFDVMLMDRRIVALSIGGRLRIWNIDDNPIAYPQSFSGPTLLRPDYARKDMTLFLARSPRKCPMIIAIWGDYWGRRVHRRAQSEQARCITVDGVVVYELDTGNNDWMTLRGFEGQRSLFLGANYPFWIEVPGVGGRIKPGRLYVSDQIGADFAILPVDIPYRKIREYERLHLRRTCPAQQAPVFIRPYPFAE